MLLSKPSARVSRWGLETGALQAVARSSCLSASPVLKSRNTLPVSPVVVLWPQCNSVAKIPTLLRSGCRCDTSSGFVQAICRSTAWRAKLSDLAVAPNHPAGLRSIAFVL